MRFDITIIDNNGVIPQVKPIATRTLQSAALFICYHKKWNKQTVNVEVYNDIEDELQNAVNNHENYVIFPIQCPYNLKIQCRITYVGCPITEFYYMPPTSDYIASTDLSEQHAIELIYAHVSSYWKKSLEYENIIPAIPHELIQPAITSCIRDGVKRQLQHLYFIIDNAFAVLCCIPNCYSPRFNICYSYCKPFSTTYIGEIIKLIKQQFEETVPIEKIIDTICTADENNNPYITIENHHRIMHCNIIKDKVAEAYFFPILVRKG